MPFYFPNLIKFIIVYVVFVLGISILSEWMNKTSKCNQKSSINIYSEKLDKVLENIKQEVKKDYLKKFRESGINEEDLEQDLDTPEIGGPGLQKEPEFQENFQNYVNDARNKKYLSQEEIELMEHVNSKLNENVYNGNDINLYNKSRFTPPEDVFTTKNIYKNFKKISNNAIDYSKNDTNYINMNNKKYLDVDGKYRFSSSLKPKDKLVIPKNKGFAPEKYLFKNNPELRHTFFDDKYDPENYKVSPMDEYSEDFYQIIS